MRFYDFSEHAQPGQSVRSHAGACAGRLERFQQGWSVRSEAGAWTTRVIGFWMRTQRGWSVCSKVRASAVISKQAKVEACAPRSKF